MAFGAMGSRSKSMRVDPARGVRVYEIGRGLRPSNIPSGPRPRHEPDEPDQARKSRISCEGLVFRRELARKTAVGRLRIDESESILRGGHEAREEAWHPPTILLVRSPEDALKLRLFVQD